VNRVRFVLVVGVVVASGGALVLATACKKTNEAIVDAGSVLESTAEPSTGIVMPPPRTVDPRRTIDPIESVVLAWNAALDGHDPGALEKLYGAKVRLYGREMSRADAVASKKKALEKQKGFKQLVVGITIDHGTGDRPRANFTKIVTSNGVAKSYAAYLVLATPTGKLEIVEESDQTTDANLKPADDDACAAAAASAAMGASKIGKSLSEPITPDQADAGCTSHGLMPMPAEKNDRFVTIRLHTNCDDRVAFRGLFYVSTADGCVYEDAAFAMDESKYTKLECTKDAPAVKTACKR